MTLTIQDLGALGELLGSVAVLATLVYLAFQTRQNTMAIEAQLDATRMAAVKDLDMVAATSNELLETLNSDRVEPRPLEHARLDRYWRARFCVIEWWFTQLRRSVVSSEEAQIAHRLGTFFNDFRSIEGWWGNARPSFNPEFVEWVEEQRSKAA